MNKHIEKGINKQKKDKSKKKNISSSSLKNFNINKSTHSKTSIQPSENGNSQSKVPTFKHESSSIEKVNISLIDKTYKDKLKEKDDIINKLQTKLLVYKSMYKNKCGLHKKKNKSFFDLKIEDTQKRDKNRNKRMINLYTLNTKNLFKILRLSQYKSKSIAKYSQSKTNSNTNSSSNNNKHNHITYNKTPQKMGTHYSKSTDSIPLFNNLSEIEKKGERNQKTFESSIRAQCNKNRTQSSMKSLESTKEMLKKLKQKTLSVLNKYNNNINYLLSNGKQ